MSEGAVTINLDKPRRLRFDINNLADADNELRIGLAAILRTADWRIPDTRTLLFHGLREEDQTLTKVKIGALMYAHIQAGGTLADLNKQIVDALRACGFIREEKKTEAATATESPTSLSETGSPTPSEQRTDR